MKVGLIPQGPLSYEDLVRVFLTRPAVFRARLFPTVRQSGYFTEGTLFTRMQGDERRIFARLQNGDEEGEPFDVRKVLPASLGEKVLKATYAGKGKEHPMVLLQGNKDHAIVEARLFRTLLTRHPVATWWFARDGASKGPVVLLEEGGFTDGQIAGTVVPLRMKDEVREEIPLPKRVWKLTPVGLRYRRVEKK